jgi:hypothetical protein
VSLGAFQVVVGQFVVVYPVCVTGSQLGIELLEVFMVVASAMSTPHPAAPQHAGNP